MIDMAIVVGKMVLVHATHGHLARIVAAKIATVPAGMGYGVYLGGTEAI